MKQIREFQRVKAFKHNSVVVSRIIIFCVASRKSFDNWIWKLETSVSHAYYVDRSNKSINHYSQNILPRNVI